MNKNTYCSHGLWAGAGAVIVLLCVSLFGPAGAPSMPQTRDLHFAAYRTDVAQILNGVALLAPPPIRPGTAKRSGSTPIVSRTVRPAVSKPTPRLFGVQSGVAGVNVGQDGALALGVAGTTMVTQNGPLTIGPGEEWTASAACPSGLATGGGESNTSSAGVVLNQSYAYSDGSGWIVEVRNQSAQSATYTVYAVCSTGLTNYTTVSSNITLGPGQYGEADANCPEGTNVRGTGVQAGLKAGIQYFFTKRKIEAALIDVTNLDTNYAQYGAQAICAAGTPLGDDEFGNNVDLPPNGYVKASVQDPNANDGMFSGGGGAPEAQSGASYVTDSYPDTSGNGNATWSVFVRNTSNTDEYAIGTLYDTSS